MCIINTSAQVDISYNYFRNADSLYKAGKFEESIINCERYLFYEPFGQYRTNIMIIEAKDFQQIKNFNNSTEILLSIPRIHIDNSLNATIHYNLALNNYMTENYEEAKIYIDQCFKLNVPSEIHENAEILKILIFCELTQWDSIKNIVKHSNYLKKEQKDSLLKLLDKKPKLFNGKRLEWYSRFVPGSGQFIAGHVFEGLMSFVFCASSLSFGIYEVLNKYYFTGYFVGAGFLNNFYSGGIRRLNQIVVYENKKRIEKFNKKIRNVIY